MKIKNDKIDTVDNETNQNNEPLKGDEARDIARELQTIRGFFALFYGLLQFDGDLTNVELDDLCVIVLDSSYKLKTAIDRLGAAAEAA